MSSIAELCQWLRDNSSGIYRPAAEAATELERLTAELAAARVDAERFHWLREWLVRNGQLLCVECQPTAGAKVGPYWVFRRAYMVDGTSLEGYGKTEDAAIDAARQAG